MTSQTITIPAREVRPGDVLFGMTVDQSMSSIEYPGLRCIDAGNVRLWLGSSARVPVERPVPSDPIGTVRAEFVDGQVKALYRKGHEWHWFDSNSDTFADADVADFPILWKPGMPIPTEGSQA